MYQQTIELCKSLPHFAPWIKAADRKGSSAWEIVRWTGSEPKDVKPSDVRAIDETELVGVAERNQFKSRTEALRASERITRQFMRSRSEHGHWGAWRWTQDGQTYFQTALPVNRRAGQQVDVRTAKESNGSGSGSMVRIGEQAYRMLRRRAAEEKLTLQATLEAAIDHYDRHRFFERTNEAFDAMRADPEAWAAELAERREWDATLMDGIEEEDFSYLDGPEAAPAEERKIA
jgi:hypothetical protein